MRFRKLIIGVDFGPAADAAARWAVGSLAPGAEAVLVHVLPPPPSLPLLVHDVAPPEVEEEQARRALAVRAAGLEARVATELRRGTPHRELAAAAVEHGADLLVIAPHGERLPGFLGTTAERLARTSPVPVLVAANPPARPLAHVVATLDDSDTLGDVLAWTRALAAETGAAVAGLHVLHGAVYTHVASLASVTSQGDEQLAARRVARELDAERGRWAGQLAAAGIEGTVEVRWGQAGEEILAFARAAGADLIVMGRHGSGEVLRAFLGSTAHAVLQAAPCPVFVAGAGPAPVEPRPLPGIQRP